MKYRLTRNKVTTMVLEVDASSPDDAVRLAQLRPHSKWKASESGGLAEIDAVSEGGDGRCWGVDEDIDGNIHLHEVDGIEG